MLTIMLSAVMSIMLSAVSHAMLRGDNELLFQVVQLGHNRIEEKVTSVCRASLLFEFSPRELVRQPISGSLNPSAEVGDSGLHPCHIALDIALDILELGTVFLAGDWITIHLIPQTLELFVHLPSECNRYITAFPKFSPSCFRRPRWQFLQKI
ncbi:hypothetical protein BGW80DRAFT_1343461 [Lactifluus volemus]|nr:hypothetical protein BGW80DRAFT_1343461 [Lactifluus volemus]